MMTGKKKLFQKYYSNVSFLFRNQADLYDWLE